MEKKTEKQLMVMTSFGLVPFDAVKKYFDPKVTESIENNKEEILKRVEEAHAHCNPIYYIERLAKRHSWKPEDMDKYLRKLYSINKGAAFSTILREVAIALDEKYEDHISNSNEIFVVNITSGNISKADKTKIKNYKFFAAFRSMEDARFACHVMKYFLRDMYSNSKEKALKVKEGGE